MPRVAFDDARGGVIARYREDVRSLAQKDRQSRVQFLHSFGFSRKVTVFTIHIGIFEMEEEVIVVAVFSEVPLELLADRLRSLELGHPDKLRQSLIHGINRNARGPQTVTLLERWDGRLMRNPSQQESVRGFFSGDDRQR